jgi:hypothetical protein
MSKIGLVLFCLRSLWKEYGWEFMRRIVLRHPKQAVRGVLAFVRQERRARGKGAPSKENLEGFCAQKEADARFCVLGLGFCLKPIEPACPSGRANHDCQFFTRQQAGADLNKHAACRVCSIRLVGERAMNRGWSLYIMTSAQDILHDLLLPVLEKKRYSRAVLSLCRYSFDPFRIAVSVVGLNAVLIPFESGDCRDYRSWRMADKGIKDEQTCFSEPDLASLMRAFPEAVDSRAPGRIAKQGHIFFPQ